MKVSELTGIALDWAVCKATGLFEVYPKQAEIKTFLRTWGTLNSSYYVHPSTNWAQGGQIIEREGIDVYCTLLGRPDHENISWQKSNWRARYSRMGIGSDASFGHSALEAAMRCYCCSKLGDEIEIPEELL